MVLLEFQNVCYLNDQKMILQNLSVAIEAGEFMTIRGPSGSGKSTFLKLCCHLISPSHGRIAFLGQDLREYNPLEVRRRMGYCFQTPYLFGETVEDNLAFPYAIRNLKIDLARVHELFVSFNLPQDLLKQEVRNLSGGEKQRIALIRTLLLKPEVLLLDEVTSALDIDNTVLVEKNMKALNETGTTILWITHNPEQNQKNAHKIITIENGEIKAVEEVKCQMEQQ